MLTTIMLLALFIVTICVFGLWLSVWFALWQVFPPDDPWERLGAILVVVALVTILVVAGWVVVAGLVA